MITATQIELLPTEYKPRVVNDFVGPARDVARRLTNSAKMCLPKNSPASHLLVGPSGSGKTGLAQFALDLFGVQQWTITEVFGSDLTIDVARDIAADMRMTNIFGGYRGVFIDEIDKCTKEARDRLLGIVGEYQPKSTLIIATSNLSLKLFDDLEKTKDMRGRFSSRWQCHEVPCPTVDEAVPLLMRWVEGKIAHEIATLAATDENGKFTNAVNMRAALKDVASWMQR
jgi:DNA replication protein DnaC